MGFTGMAGGSHFFVFLDAADSMAIGEKLYYQAKLYFHAKPLVFDAKMIKTERINEIHISIVRQFEKLSQ